MRQITLCADVLDAENPYTQACAGVFGSKTAAPVYLVMAMVCGRVPAYTPATRTVSTPAS